jgi:hypothetical protein
MFHRWLLLLLVAAFWGLGCTASGGTTTTTSGDAAPTSTFDQVVLKPTDGVVQAGLQTALGGLGLGDASLQPSTLNWWLATFPATDPPRDEAAGSALVAEVAALAEVAIAEPNAVRTAK